MTATGTSRRLAGAALGLLVLVAVAACGGGGGMSSTGASHPQQGAFAWLRPAGPPANWTIARLPSGQATLAYPPGWRAIQSDPGTVSAALRGRSGRIRGYLNVTPRSGAETLANWASFRPAHNHEEGDRAVRRLAAAGGLNFRSGSGSCVIDSYKTSSDRYKEIACIVRGAHATTVVVGAAEPAAWPALAPQLEQAVSSFTT
ncbi:MAG: hypothetical protein ACXVRH_01430 [Thermoleophilaceae bacterium]